MWLVMIVRHWTSYEGYLGAIPVQVAAPDNGSVGFVAVFETREAALAAADGRADLVMQVKEVPRA